MSVERDVPGHDYRLLVANGSMVAAARREARADVFQGLGVHNHRETSEKRLVCQVQEAAAIFFTSGDKVCITNAGAVARHPRVALHVLHRGDELDLRARRPVITRSAQEDDAH